MLKEKTKKSHNSKVLQVKKVANSSYLIELEAPSEFESKAGQYISILCPNLTLRRPFSIAFQESGKIGILFKEKGKGTKYIKSLNIGDTVDFIGALGNGFNISDKKSLLIGAGIGAAPIFYLQSTLTKTGTDFLSVGAFTSKNEIPQNLHFDKFLTDDGTFGENGNILQNLDSILQEYKPEIIYACGPKIVLSGIVKIAEKYEISTQVAMEKVMACGIGVCRGCAIKLIKNDRIQNATVCKDGPVFIGKEVIWE